MAAHLNGPSIRPASKNQNRKFYDHPGSGRTPGVASTPGGAEPQLGQFHDGCESVRCRPIVQVAHFKHAFFLNRRQDPAKLLYVVTIYTLHDRDELLVRSQRFAERKSERLGLTRTCSASHVTTRLLLR